MTPEEFLPILVKFEQFSIRTMNNHGESDFCPICGMPIRHMYACAECWDKYRSKLRPLLDALDHELFSYSNQGLKIPTNRIPIVLRERYAKPAK